MAYTATHRFARISARKVRPLANLIRGKHADEALDILKYMPQRGARLLEKVLKSALGNAEDRRAANISDLVVVDARVDGGPMFKRIQPRARGMAFMIKKRMAHIRVSLDAIQRASLSDSDEFRIAVPEHAATTRNDLWVKKSIRSDSASASWKAGRAAGMPRSRNSRTAARRP